MFSCFICSHRLICSVYSKCPLAPPLVVARMDVLSLLRAIYQQMCRLTIDDALFTAAPNAVSKH